MTGIHDPFYSEAEEAAALAAVRSGWVSGGGAKVDSFEQELGGFFGLRELPVATANGSSALLLALRAVAVPPGEHVLVSDYGFVATANSVHLAGAEPILIGPASAGLPIVSLEQLCEFFSQKVDERGCYRSTGKRIAGMLYNEPYGFTCANLAGIAELFRSRGLFLVEDSAQAFGIRQDGRWLGTFGDLGIFSFNGNKTLTTGTGGLLVGKNPELLARARKLRHQSRSDPFEFFYDEVGHNFLLSNVLGAIGLEQARKLPEILARKVRIRDSYASAFAGSALSLQGPVGSHFPAWLNVVRFPRAFPDRDSLKNLAARLLDHGAQVRPAFPEVSTYPMYSGAAREFSGDRGHFFHSTLCLPSGAGVSPEEAARVASVLLSESRSLGLL